MNELYNKMIDHEVNFKSNEKFILNIEENKLVQARTTTTTLINDYNVFWT